LKICSTLYGAVARRSRVPRFVRIRQKLYAGVIVPGVVTHSSRAKYVLD